MLDFIFNTGGDLLISNENRYSHTLKMRMKDYGIKYKEILNLPQEVRKCLENNGNGTFALFQKTFDLCLKCSGYEFYKFIRNMYDYEFHMKDLMAVNNFNNSVLSKEQATIFLEVFNLLMPSMEYHFKEATKEEAKRKSIIESAGMVYQRHYYPDYTGCDELFYDFPDGPEDSVLHDAMQVLKSRGIRVESVV